MRAVKISVTEILKDIKKNVVAMKKLFQREYILRAIAFTVLALVVAITTLPKVEEYNSAVYEKQNELRMEADAVVENRRTSFEIYVLNKGINFNSVFIVILLALFLSLLLTKRIVLSLLFALLLFLQIVILDFLRIDYFANSYFVEFLFIACWFSLSFWLASVSCRLIYSKLQSEILLK